MCLKTLKKVCQSFTCSLVNNLDRIDNFDLLVWPELTIDFYYKSIGSNFGKEVSLHVCLIIAIQNVMPIQKEKPMFLNRILYLVSLMHPCYIKRMQ